MLDQAATAKPVDGLKYLTHWERSNQHGSQLLQAHRLAHNCQPQEQHPLAIREPCELLVEQVADAAKDQRVLGQERTDCACEEISNGLRHDLQGQGIALVSLTQACPLLC